MIKTSVDIYDEFNKALHRELEHRLICLSSQEVEDLAKNIFLLNKNEIILNRGRFSCYRNGSLLKCTHDLFNYSKHSGKLSVLLVNRFNMGLKLSDSIEIISRVYGFADFDELLRFELKIKREKEYENLSFLKKIGHKLSEGDDNEKYKQYANY